MVSVARFPLFSALAQSSAVGFSGSRSSVPPAALLASVFAAVPASASVLVGCARGLDSCARAAFPSAVVFSVSSFGVGRGAFAARSVALVRSLAASPSPVFVSFPSGACPPSLVPSSSPSRCFSGLGSGSWASLALAAGLGVPCFVWLPAGVVPPPLWGFVSLGGGWFSV